MLHHSSAAFDRMTARPVLLVHGFASSFEAGWQRFGWPDRLGAGARPVIGVDLLGHGAAPKPTDPDAYAEVDDLVDRARSAHLVVDAVGFSFGCRVVLDLAMRAPESFGRIALLAPGTAIFHANDGRRLAAMLEAPDDSEVAADPRVMMFRRLARVPGFDAEALTAFLRYERAPITATELARVANLTLIVHGGRDEIADHGAKFAESALPNATRVQVPDLGHFGTPGHPAVMTAVLNFLAQ